MRRVKTYNLRSYASSAVAYCVAHLPLFVGSHALTGRLICPQHTFLLGLAVFCRSPHRVHIAFTRVARTENRVYLERKMVSTLTSCDVDHVLKSIYQAPLFCPGVTGGERVCPGVKGHAYNCCARRRESLGTRLVISYVARKPPFCRGEASLAWPDSFSPRLFLPPKESGYARLGGGVVFLCLHARACIHPLARRSRRLCRRNCSSLRNAKAVSTVK